MSELRVVPAAERLDTHEITGSKRCDRLVDDVQSTLRQSLCQLSTEHELALHVLVLRGGEELNA